jgi:hypothetical protein
MPSTRYSVEQIVAKLRERTRLLERDLSCAWLPHPSSWRRHAPRLPRPGTRPELRLAAAGPGLFMGASVTADG